MIKKRVLISLLLIIVLIVCWGCDKDQTSPHTDSDYPGVLVENNNWKWNNIIKSDIDISRIQISKDGTIYVLSEGVMYYLEGQELCSLNLDEEISAFCLFDNLNSTKIIVGTINGNVYVKSKEDVSWEKGSIDLHPFPVDIIIVSSADESLYLGQSSKKGGGLWKSIDGGITWNKLSDITVRGIAVHPENPEILYIVDRLTYFSTDGGSIWHKMNTGANYGVLIHPHQPDTVYIPFARGVVTATHDGKINSQQQFYLPGGMTRLEYNPATLSQWALGMWDYPSGTGGLYYTFNGGGRWIEAGEEMKNTRVMDLRYSRDGKFLYIGTAGKGLWMLNIEQLKDE